MSAGELRATAEKVQHGCWYACRICGTWLIVEESQPVAPADRYHCRGCSSWMTFKFSRRVPDKWLGKGMIWRAPGQGFVTPQMEREREILHDHYHGKHARCAEIFKPTVSCQSKIATDQETAK
jgi:hypothetical protein